MYLNYSDDPFSKEVKYMEAHMSKCPNSLKNSKKMGIPNKLRDEALNWYTKNCYFDSIIEPNIIENLIQFSIEGASSYDFSMKYFIDSLLKLSFESGLLQEVKSEYNVYTRYNTNLKELSENTKILYYYLTQSIACFIDCFCTDNIYRKKVNISRADFFEVYSNTFFLVSVIDIKRIKGGNKPKILIGKSELTQDDRIKILNGVKKGLLLKTLLLDMDCYSSRSKLAKQVASFYHYCEKEIANGSAGDNGLEKWCKQFFI